MVGYSTVPIKVKPGVIKDGSTTGQSSTDTPYWVDSDKMRFVDGIPESIEGTSALSIPGGFGTDGNMSVSAISGVVRGTFYYEYGTGISNYRRVAIGTSRALYLYYTGYLYNITPLKTSTTALANNPITTYYDSGEANPFTTVNGSTTVTLTTNFSAVLRVGDQIAISGVAATVNGIPAGSLNGTRAVISFSGGNPQVTAGAAATSSGNPAVASVVFRPRIVKITDAAHGFLQDYRIKLVGVAAVGGHGANVLDGEWIIRTVVDASNYIVAPDTFATSATTGGGAAVTRQGQVSIADDANDPNLITWSFDRFNDDLVCCPGRRGGVYRWQNNTAVAAVLVTNAPAQANWIFTSNGKLVVLGAYSTLVSNQRDNRIKNSQIGDLTTWTLTAGSGAYEDEKEGVGRFVCAVKADQIIYLFTSDAVCYLRDIGGDDVWEFGVISEATGIRASRAAFEVDGNVYFAGTNGFYRLNGTILEEMPNNTLKNYALQNFTPAGDEFARFSERYREVYFHYPSVTGNPYISCPIGPYQWAYGTMSRCGFFTLGTTEYGIDESGNFWDHSSRTAPNFDGVPKASFIESNYSAIGQGDDVMTLCGMEPPSGGQVDNISVTITTMMRGRDADAGNSVVYGPYTVAATTNKIDFIFAARYRKVKFMTTGSTNQFMRIDGWKEFLKKAGKF